MKPDVQSQSSPRPTPSATAPGLLDSSLLGRDKSTLETGAISSQINSEEDDFDITVADLPEKLGFSPQFLEELNIVGGNPHYLAERLLSAFNLDDSGGFRAGQLCSTPEQLDFYMKHLDAGPMVIRWLTTGYEIPFSKVPKKPLRARNNKSCINNIDFAREELQRQVNCGILSEVSYEPLVVNSISCVFSQ